ncbi:Intraflagellar transport protein 172 homolog [Eumeta japonica]|uniref:Intraflagellar transport protein 172 homolog n=1 Tax=Eumeta variegata TaxID=151549 RepID=A0A4C1TML3_EUMVA|nr:Intraflagellar transport protein 172 homolog [Eumeta japonica]
MAYLGAGRGRQLFPSRCDRYLGTHKLESLAVRLGEHIKPSVPDAVITTLTVVISSSHLHWLAGGSGWDIAMELSEMGGGVSRREVARHEAAALADDQPEEAEAAFLRAAAPDDAVRMWLSKGHHQRALTLAEQHASHMMEEVLVEMARAAAERGDLVQFEALMIRANRPRDVVQHYKDIELWEEASRVAREYLPDSAEPVPATVPPLLQRAADHADRGEWWEAVELLCAASAAGAAGGAARLAERAALRAARLARDHLNADRRRHAADMLYERFAAIGQSDVGDQLRAALAGGFTGNEGGDAGHVESEEEEMGEAAGDANVGELGDGESGSLERLARAGQWERCLAQAGPRAPHYALRYAVHLFQVHPRTEGVQIDGDDVGEGLAVALDVLRRVLSAEGAGDAEVRLLGADVPLARSVCGELSARISATPYAYARLRDACKVLFAAGAEERMLQAVTLLSALHVPQVSSRAARALPRYTDIIVADAVLYAAGRAIRDEGAAGTREAFVFLNRCLDLVEAADEDSHHLLDHTDFECTDWPSKPLLFESACVRGTALDETREWVLAVSMDQSVEQTLPVDDRGLYAASVSGEAPHCVLTGYPLGERVVTFANGRCANREWWSRVWNAARAPDGDGAADLIAFITLWCGPADYRAL